MLLHAVGLLSGLAATVFAVSVRDRYGALTLAAGLLMGVARLQPGPGWTGAVVATTAGLALVRPGGTAASLAAPLVAGLAGGLWSRVLSGYGLPLWLTGLLASGVIAVAAVSSARDPRFAAPSVPEDALAALGVLGVAVAGRAGGGGRVARGTGDESRVGRQRCGPACIRAWSSRSRRPSRPAVCTRCGGAVEPARGPRAPVSGTGTPTTDA